MDTISSVMPARRCSRTSPRQRMTFRPAQRAARVLMLTVASVSPKYCRLSEWPTITYSAPASRSISAEISPVKAPLASKWTFCAPILTQVPFAASTAGMRSTAGTQRTTSHPFLPAVSSAVFATAAFASEGVMFIFQLPAMMTLRDSFFMSSYSFWFVNLEKGKRRRRLPR